MGFKCRRRQDMCFAKHVVSAFYRNIQGFACNIKATKLIERWAANAQRLRHECDVSGHECALFNFRCNNLGPIQEVF